MNCNSEDYYRASYYCFNTRLFPNNHPNPKGSKNGLKQKERFTSAAVIYLGASVTHTNGIAMHIMHIRGIINKSLFSNFI